MSNDLLSSIGPVLAAPWHQRRNIGSLWGLGLVVFMVFLGPLAMACWSFFELLGSGATTPGALAASGAIAAQIRHSAVSFAIIGLALLVLGWWALLVSNLLQQNRPALARLVPHHPARLRTAMVVAWALCTAIIAGLMGGRFDHPMLCTAVAALVLALVAMSIRWLALGMSGVLAPMVMLWFDQWPGHEVFQDAVAAQWSAQSGSITGTLAGASVVMLCGLIQSGGKRHVASDGARMLREQRFQARTRGTRPDVAIGRRGTMGALFVQPYYAWWRRVMARPQASVSTRLMLGLGPNMHWTASATAVVLTLAIMSAVFGVAMVLGPLLPWLRDFIGGMFVGIVVGLVPAVMSTSLQARALLYQTQREQGLLALLPGAPRGPALSRSVALQLTAQFLLALAGGWMIQQLSVVEGAVLVPETARVGFVSTLGRWLLIGMVPTLAFQWRNWSRLGASPGLQNLVPLLVAGLATAGVAALTRLHLCSEPVAALIVVVATAAWCAMRWQRMGREPASLPAGRLA